MFLLDLSLNILSVLSSLFGQFLDVLDNLIGAVIVFIIGYVLAKVFSKTATKILAKSGVDTLGEKLNEIDVFSKMGGPIVLSTVCGKIFYYLIIILFSMAATEVLGMEAVSNLMVDLVNYIPNLIAAGIVIIIGSLFADFVKGIVHTSAKSIGLPSANIIANFVFYFLFIAVIMSALGQAKINTDFLRNNLTVIVAGIVLAFALGYGFASKDMMANFIASFYSKSKIEIGDKIQIGDVNGIVVAVDHAALTVEVEDGEVMVPLSKLTSENVKVFNS